MNEQQPKLLIVDDRPENLVAMERVLRKLDTEIFKADSGNAALSLTLRHDFALVLLDVQMPIMDGFEVASLMHDNEATRHVPIIFVTAINKDEAHEFRGYQAGAVDYLFKPVNPDILTSKVHVFLELYRQKQALDVMDELKRSQAELQREIAERNRSEAQLREREEQLRQSQKMEAVGVLAGGVAHEFNNLLQAIGGYAKFAMDSLVPDEQPYQDLVEIVKATKRATTLTRGLLGFSRQGVIQPQHIKPNDLIADALAMLRPLIGEHIELDTDLDHDLRTICVDPTMMHQALVNLCLNARDAMPSGGRLLVTAVNDTRSNPHCRRSDDVKPGPCVVLTVADTGCGMSLEVKEHIFEPFYTTKEVGEGTGLGLSMVYGVVQQHQGTIHVESEPGKGTTFRIYLPVAEGEAEADNTEQTTPVMRGTETILVAEDEPLVCDIMSRILTDVGYNVLVAKDGEEAVRVFEENSDAVHLALLDVVMPKMNGHDVLERIKLSNPEIRVLFCSGYDPDATQTAFPAVERQRFIQKPVDSDALLSIVREELDKDAESSALQTTA